MFEQDNMFGMRFTYQIYICLQMFLSRYSEESDLNYVDFYPVDLSHIPRIIIGNQFYCFLPISFTKTISTSIEEPLYK